MENVSLETITRVKNVNHIINWLLNHLNNLRTIDYDKAVIEKPYVLYIQRE